MTTETTTQTADAVPETIDENAEAKASLIAQLAVLKAREKALKELIDERRASLSLLMKRDGDSVRQTLEGKASFISKRKAFTIHNRAEFAAMFDKQTLVEAFKCDAAFYDAAIEAGLPIEGVVIVEEDEQFKVESRRTAAEKERQRRIMDETKREMNARIERLAMLMRQQNRESANG